MELRVSETEIFDVCNKGELKGEIIRGRKISLAEIEFLSCHGASKARRNLLFLRKFSSTMRDEFR